MPFRVVDNGKNNKISIDADVLEKGAGGLIVNGSDNEITIERTSFFFGGSLTIDSDCVLHVRENINCRNLFVHMGARSTLRLGAGVSLNGLVRMLLHEPASISIGAGCLIADQVDITVSDMHSVIDLETGRRINPARDVVIGDRVWIGQRSLVLKGSTIGSGAVVGAHSLVSRDVPGNCVVAGNPVTVVRQNATWDIKLL